MNRLHVDEWKYVSIVPLSLLETMEADIVLEDEDEDEDGNIDISGISISLDHNLAMYEGDCEVLCEMLSIGDNFVVKTAEKNEDFYLLKCTKTMYKTTRVEKDRWHNKIVRVEYWLRACTMGKLKESFPHSPCSIISLQ